MKLLVLVSLFTLFSSSIWAQFGPFPHNYFQKGERLSCHEGDPCVVPRFDDMEALKNDWAMYEEKRLERVERLQALARKKAEVILQLAQEELSDNEQSRFGQIYMEYGSKLLSNIGEKKIEKIRLWVSASSPMYEKLLELEALLVDFQNRIENQVDPELKEALTLLRAKNYREWVMGDEFQNILLNMRTIQKEFFPKEEEEGFEGEIVEGLINLSLPLKDYFEFSECPKKARNILENHFGAIQFSRIHRRKGDWDPVEHRSFLKFLIDGNNFGDSLKVSCEKGGFLDRPGAAYESGHKLKVTYKTKTESDGSETFRMPSREDILSVLN